MSKPSSTGSWFYFTTDSLTSGHSSVMQTTENVTTPGDIGFYPHTTDIQTSYIGTGEDELTTATELSITSLIETISALTEKDDVTASETLDVQSSDGPRTGNIIIGSVLLLFTVVTIVGNLLVIISPFVDRKLRNTFTYYIINLGMTDFLVALTAMSFYSFDIMLGYWPFGEVMCGVWIFFDYGMTFSSVFTLMVISVDRYWSVGWSLHYRSHNTMKKCATMIAVVWLSVLAVWLAPCILDRIRWSEPGVCKWEPSKNKEFVIFVAVVGHHTPCAVIIFCYYKIYMIMRAKKRSVAPKTLVTPPENANGHTLQVPGPIDNPTVSNRASSKKTLPTLQLPILPDNTSVFEAQAGKFRNAEQSSTAGETSTQSNMKKSDDVHLVLAERHKRKEDKEFKAFMMLSYILFSYLLCWVPFHVIFDISAIRPELVPEWLYITTFWLTYCNSTINPFVYAFTSSSFRSAFLKIVKCKLCCRG